MRKFKIKPKHFFWGATLVPLMYISTSYALDYQKDKAHKDQAKTEIKKLTHEIDSINNTGIDAICKLTAELDILSAMADPKYKAPSDSILREIETVKQNTQNQIATKQQRISDLAKQYNIQATR